MARVNLERRAQIGLAKRARTRAAILEAARACYAAQNGTPVTVEAVVQDPDGVKQVSLRYRLAGPGGEKEEESLEMTEVCEHRFTGTIPGQKARQIIRFRIEAVDGQGARRLHPGENEPRPAFCQRAV